MGGKRLTSTEVSYMAAWALAEWKEVRLPSLDRHRVTQCSSWHKPPGGYLKLNFDAGFFYFLKNHCKQELGLCYGMSLVVW